MTQHWSQLPLEPWVATRDTLHSHTQILGKLAVALAPPEPQLQHTALRLTARGWETPALPAPDGSGALAAVLDLHTHEAVVDRIWADHPDLDLVLVAFGQLGDQDQLDADPAAAARLAVTNYAGAVSSSLAAAKHLRAQGHGTLVVLSSVAGQRGRADNYVYGSTKAGLDAFAQGLGDRLAGSGASVMVVRPGFVRTSMTAGMVDGPMATPAEAVAADIVAGLRRGAHTVWSPAQLRWVFAILKVLPRPIWRKLAATRS